MFALNMRRLLVASTCDYCLYPTTQVSLCILADYPKFPVFFVPDLTTKRYNLKAWNLKDERGSRFCQNWCLKILKEVYEVSG